MTASLLLALRAGDSGAGSLLDRLYRSPLQRFCTRYLGNSEDARDAVQAVFCKVLGTDKVPDDFKVWLYRIARNHCLNLLRSRRRKKDARRLQTGLDRGADWTGHLTRLVRAEEAQRLVAALERLPEEFREALYLRYGEALSRDEIARLLDVSVSVVKYRLFEGLKKLRTDLETG